MVYHLKFPCNKFFFRIILSHINTYKFIQTRKYGKVLCENKKRHIFHLTQIKVILFICKSIQPETNLFKILLRANLSYSWCIKIKLFQSLSISGIRFKNDTLFNLTNKRLINVWFQQNFKIVSKVEYFGIWLHIHRRRSKQYKDKFKCISCKMFRGIS